MQDPIKVCSLIFDAQDAFDAIEAEKMAAAMGWTYGHTPKGQTASANEILGCLAACVNMAISNHHKNCEQGNPFKFIGCTTGRVSVRVDFFNPESPQVTISFGMQVWKS